MPKTLFQRISDSLVKDGVLPSEISPRPWDSDVARKWFRQKILNLKPTREALMKDRERLRNKTIIGRMYFYFYDPKHKDTLPYYDLFPLTIPIQRYNDGFLGLNLHYIHPKHRIILLNKLSEYATDPVFDENTRLRLSYATLSSASKMFEATPCIKRYLYGHVQSRFLEITPDEWDIAVMLPFEQFVGARKTKVWTDSRKKF